MHIFEYLGFLLLGIVGHCVHCTLYSIVNNYVDTQFLHSVQIKVLFSSTMVFNF